MDNPKTIPFAVEVEAKGISILSTKDIPVDALKENLRQATNGLAEVFRDIRQVGSFELSEINLGLEINAEGGIRFIGSAKAGAKAAVNLKFSAPELIINR